MQLKPLYHSDKEVFCFFENDNLLTNVNTIHMKVSILALMAILVLSLVACTPAEDPASTGGSTTSGNSPEDPIVDEPEATVAMYEADIKPIIELNCLGCHSGPKAKEGFDVSSYDSMMKGTEHGPAIEAGNSANSLMMKAIKGDGAKKMPPGGTLTDDEIAKIAAWIDAGAENN